MAISAILQGAVGFGLGLIAIPFLIYLDLRFVPGPLLVAALTLHMLVLQRDRSGVDKSGLTMLLSGRVLGTIPAAMLLASLPIDSMKILVAAVVARRRRDGPAAFGRASHAPVLFTAGAASGFMATAAGLGGPPVALVYQRETGAASARHACRVFHRGNGALADCARVGGTIRCRRNAPVCVPDSRHRARLLHVTPGCCVPRQRPHESRSPQRVSPSPRSASS